MKYLDILSLSSSSSKTGGTKCVSSSFFTPALLATFPTSSGDVNKEWTTNLSEKTMNKFRVHLSWVMGLSVFEWSPREIGNQIIETFKKSGVFKSLTEVIIRKSSSVDYDYILC